MRLYFSFFTIMIDLEIMKNNKPMMLGIKCIKI